MALEKYIKECPAGTVIFNQGDAGDEMYVVKDGKVKIEITIQSKNQEIIKSLGEIQSGEFFGEMAIIDNSPRTARAVAITDTQLVILNHNRFYKLIESSPEFAIKIVRKIATRVKEANDRMKNLVSVKKKSQIISFLLESIQKKGSEKLSLSEFYSSTLVDETFKEEDILKVLKKLEKVKLLEFKKDQEIQVKSIEDLNKILDFVSIFEEEN